MTDTGYNAWLMGKRSPMSESRYAVKQWELILVNSSSLVLRRNGTFLDAQTVKVEKSSTSRELGNTDAVTITRDVIVFGVKGHPHEDIADTDIQNGDEFGLDGEIYVVDDVIPVVGGIQAHCLRKV